MMLTREDCHEFETYRFSACASDIGLKAGDWPTSIETDLGNGQPFLRQSKKVDAGSLLWVTYAQALGCIFLRIYND